ncbi:hypothetical protein [Photobacterium kishitanii]|uniref:hypothetical protein n=1 Tax=Photobacterium kishitanii TaxID=318456 RepID=UPI0027397C41|nr:hypothetical protein [Photobacterium kishitanii]
MRNDNQSLNQVTEYLESKKAKKQKSKKAKKQKSKKAKKQKSKKAKKQKSRKAGKQESRKAGKQESRKIMRNFEYKKTQLGWVFIKELKINYLILASL